jgi:hypothetical protein
VGPQNRKCREDIIANKYKFGKESFGSFALLANFIKTVTL